MPRFAALFVLLSIVFAAEPQFTARELFYSAASEPKPAAPPAAPTPAPAARKSAPAAQTAPPKKAPVKPPTPPPGETAAATPVQRPVNQHTQPQPVTLPDGATIIKASATQAPSTAPAPTNGTPLGLRYTILKKTGEDMVEVAPDTVFHAGDKIQLSVQTNGPGYLYIVSQGTSGTWQPLFPSAEIADGNNHVDGWNARTLPPNTRLVFDERTGTEKVFVVFSRVPEDGLENMIYSLQGSKAKPAADKPTDDSQPGKRLQMAVVNIDDSTVGRLRDTYTRDLIIEKVDDKTPADKQGDKKENAVYVVNPSGSAESRLVADIRLVHQ